jgi:hypothetical protein
MIHGLTPRLAEGGKIKIGGLGAERKARSGRTYRAPEKHDCFTVTTCEREPTDPGKPDGDLIIDQPVMDALVEYGFADADGKIRTIPIVLHSDDLEQVFPTAYVAYQGKRLACRGDGRTAERRQIIDGNFTGETKTVECPCDLLEENSKGVRRCKYSGILHCSINVPGQSVAGSVYKWRTTSRISCEQMLGSLLQILRYAGTLQGFPLVLRVRPMRVQRPTASVTVYVCHVELREALIDAQRSALEVVSARSKLAGAFLADRDQDYARMLQLPGGEDEAEQDNVGPEFFPDAPGVDRPPVDTPPVDTPPPDWLCKACGKYHPATFDACPEPPADPAPPKRRKRCKKCNELSHGVENGLCPACSAKHGNEPPQPPQPPKLPDTKKCAMCMTPFEPASINDALCLKCTPGNEPPASDPPAEGPSMMCGRCDSGPH